MLHYQNSEIIETGNIDKIPTFFLLMHLRMERHGPGKVNPSYLFFCQHFLIHVVGKKKFENGLHHGMKLSQIATVSDEAFALLLVENSETRWKRVFEANYGGGPIPSTKYTFKGSSKVGTGCTIKYHGWSRDGLQQFNDLCAMVKQDRRLHADTFDNAFDDHWNKLHSRQMVQKNNWGPPISVYNDLFECDEEHQNEEDGAVGTGGMLNGEFGNSDGEGVGNGGNLEIHFAEV
jgi:hypothetical protein